LAAIVGTLWEGILTGAVEVNRAALGPIVFRSKDAMEKLNQIVLPAFAALVEIQLASLASEGVNLFVMEAVVLVEAHWQYLCDEVWVVMAPTTLTLERLMERNHLNEEEATKRIDSQMDSNTYQLSDGFE
jgi:phosphopantetheine adenylyltransferase/dephospho-CoA kinase